MFDALTPIPPAAFDKLIDCTAGMRKQLKLRGQLRPLIVATAAQRADGLWREQIFIPADAVILTAIDLLVATGASRAAVNHALDDIQLSIVGVLDRLDRGEDVVLMFVHDGRKFAVMAGAFAEAAQAVAAALGPDLKRLAAFCVPLRQACATVRARAQKRHIALPSTFWLTPEEWDAGVAVVMAIIAPRVSPIISKWQAARADEHAAAAGRLT